jgi:uridine kinase
MSGCMTDAGARLAELARAAPARAGETRVLAIDGRSGSGKSALAATVAEILPAPLVSLEQLYGGWDGLRAGIDRLVTAVLMPLADGRPANVPRYDWVSGRWLRPERLAPPPILIVEGVGAGALAGARYLSVLVWVDLPDGSRRARAIARDGPIYAGHWEMWSEQEEEYLRIDRPAQRADVVVAGS